MTDRTPRATPARLALEAALWAGMLTLGSWRDALPPLLRGYAFDVIGPCAILLTLTQLWPTASRPRLAGGLMLALALAELSQLLDLAWLGVPAGVFDPLDLLAYAIGLALGLFADYVIPLG